MAVKVVPPLDRILLVDLVVVTCGRCRRVRGARSTGGVGNGAPVLTTRAPLP